MEKSLTKIMWLEEDLFVIDRFKSMARDDFELDLQTFNCWDDAYKALMGNIKGWDAIILDPKCKLGRGDRPKPQKFLPQVFCDLATICAKYDVVIPWYVFTDLKASVFEDLIVNDRLKYDAEWERPYYSLDEDSEQLFERIRNQVSSIDRTKIREGIHKDLFDKMSALTSFGFAREDLSTMEDILISLYEHKESKRCNFVNLRKIIESIVKSMIRLGLLPDDIRNASGDPIIGKYARLLAGLECTDNYYNYCMVVPILNKVAGSNLLSILNICHGYAHSDSSIQSRSRKDTNQYLDSVQTNNLLHASALMLADIIIMYYKFILEHGATNIDSKIFWTKTQV